MAEPSQLDQVGGLDAMRRLSERFHTRVEGSENLRPLFPRDMSALTERLALFLAEALGGPKVYTAARGKTSLGCRHAHLAISRAHTDEWLACMFAAMEDVGICGSAGERLREYLTVTAYELGDPLQPYYELPFTALRHALEADASLSTISHHGRTLLGDACLKWDSARVELLLRFGADVHTGGGLDHDALYQTARPGPSDQEAEGAEIVRILVRHGAYPDRVSGPGRAGPLHMAARRGHGHLAVALLEAGADINLRDAKGVTPLRRAVSCGQLDMVSLLLSRGADASIRAKDGQLPIDAARSEPIREELSRAMEHR